MDTSNPCRQQRLCEISPSCAEMIVRSISMPNRPEKASQELRASLPCQTGKVNAARKCHLFQPRSERQPCSPKSRLSRLKGPLNKWDKSGNGVCCKCTWPVTLLWLVQRHSQINTYSRVGWHGEIQSMNHSALDFKPHALWPRLGTPMTATISCQCTLWMVAIHGRLGGVGGWCRTWSSENAPWHG